MSDLIPKPPMDDFEARQLTEEVKADAQALWGEVARTLRGASTPRARLLLVGRVLRGGVRAERQDRLSAARGGPRR